MKNIKSNKNEISSEKREKSVKRTHGALTYRTSIKKHVIPIACCGASKHPEKTVP